MSTAMNVTQQPASSDDEARANNQLNLEFVDLLVSRMELEMELRFYQRYGIPEHQVPDGDYSAVLEPLRQQMASVEHRLSALRQDAKTQSRRLPFDVVVERYGLDSLEERVLMLALSPMLDASFRKRIARYKDNILLDYCDVDLCLGVLFDSRRERLAALPYFGETGRLARHRLVKLVVPKDANTDQLLAHELKVPGRLVNFVLGHTDMDQTLTPYARLVRPTVEREHVVLPESQVTDVLNIAEQYGGALRHKTDLMINRLGPANRGAVIQFVGPSGLGKTLMARAVATHLGTRTLEVDCGKLAGEEQRFKAVIEDLFWQARMADAVLVLDSCDAVMAAKNPRLVALYEQFEQWEGVCILITVDKERLDPGAERFVIYEFVFEPPEEDERRELWRLHLPDSPAAADDVDLDFLANQYEVTGTQIRNASVVAANMAFADSPDAPLMTADHLRRAAHTQMRASMSQYAKKSKAKISLDDLILADEQKVEIQSILDAAKSRIFVMTKWGFGRKLSTGKGLVIMFSGEPGTGKTLCAEIMANQLDYELYQVSIPQVMSKYIGETEKNISQIFASAKANHAMLLFDEADSLFANRVKVESSVDKFSNMETNLLLQEIERFEGIIILTTNLDKQIDKAFERRIQFKVRFPFPEAESRAAIWRHLFPKDCPIADDMDWDLIGKSFEISGGHIKNAVLRSAYRAAVTGGVVDMETIRFAAEQECRQAGKLFRSFKLDHEYDDDF
ncbi:MAG: SpoVK/Ycf46/Vps4 family AAA+-type ATPase [Myxococcota bacterium]|jgi:SpoVK/Ycf46/Vps4 family AAA+-type ATPase